MRLFKATFNNRAGKVQESAKWYAEIRFRGVPRRVPAFTDKSASAEFGRKLERVAALREAQAPLDLELLRWVEALPERVLGTLRRLGIVTVSLDPRRLRPLIEPQGRADLIADFAETLRAREATEKYVRLTERRVRVTFKACRFVALADIDAGRLERYLRELRDEGSRSARSSNHVLAACRAFVRWGIERRLIVTDPLATLKPLNARTDERRVRRDLSDEDLRKLVKAAHGGPVIRGVSGPTRAMVWWIAAETGLRLGEIVGLQVRDLDLDGADPALTVRAAVAKNRTATRLPIRPDLVRDLAPFVRGKLPTASLLPLPRGFRHQACNRWFQIDLKAAGIAYKDESERFADIHSLRACFVSRLIRSGASPKVVQSLARHSDARLTVGIYSKLRPDEERRALDGMSLVGPGSSSPEVLRATGSDGRSRERADVLASRLASEVAGRGPEWPRQDQETPAGSGRNESEAWGETQEATTMASIPAASTNPSSVEGPCAAGTCDGRAPAESARLGALLGVSAPNGEPVDPDLVDLVAVLSSCWPSLPMAMRPTVSAGIVAMVRASVGETRP